LNAGQIKQNRMKLAVAIGTNRHYAVHTIVGRHFVQTAKASGLPNKMVTDVIAELSDTAAKSIDQARASLPKDFPEQIATSIIEGATQRLTNLAVHSGED
jgi:serine/threonine-protein kinase HipA